jgi:hypothetical protein
MTAVDHALEVRNTAIRLSLAAKELVERVDGDDARTLELAVTVVELSMGIVSEATRLCEARFDDIEPSAAAAPGAWNGHDDDD